VVAIAARDRSRAAAAAASLGIARVHDSYDALLADPEVEAIYNPLPNHLHVPWTLRALAAGKHVLCEKPIALGATEARTLLAARAASGLQLGEAFMVRTHPQWLEARALVDGGRIGELRLVSAHFSYFQDEPSNIRNQPDIGGGGLMDIGCYPVTLSRWLFGTEPLAVMALLERDPRLGIDRLTSGLLRFAAGQASFNVSTQLVPFQRFEVFGTRGRIELPIPFNAPPDRGMRILLDDGRQLGGTGAEVIELPPVDQYTVQGDVFSRAVRGLGSVPVSLDDAIANMAVIDALFRSAASGRWEAPTTD
jgi:predicted dehydrogenase